MIRDGRVIDVDLIMGELGIDARDLINNNAIAHCPWPEGHSSGTDANPSFAIHVDTGDWICYAGCGSGPLETLVARLRGLSVEDVRRWLLSQGGDSLSWAALLKSLPTPDKIEGWTDVGAVARADYGLMDGQTTSSYFLNRGFTFDTIRKWGVRYDEKLNAVVIPIRSKCGEIVGLVRRLVPPLPTGLPKYLYTPGFRRQAHLFGAERYSGGGPTYVVEGPLDAMWMHQHGYTTTVALMGVYCSARQLQLLQTFSPHVVILLDQDDAGAEGARRLASQLSGKMLVNFAPGFIGKDVQDLTEEGLRYVTGNGVYPWR